MPRVFIGVGSNLGDRFDNVAKARRLLAASEGIKLVRISPNFETDPVDVPGEQPKFVNAAWEIETELPPKSLLSVLKGIENKLGRERPYPNAPRTIDLDILFYGEQAVEEDSLLIPHPRLHERFFVLKPMSVLAPKWMHPKLGQTMEKLLEALLEARPQA
ncbi:MAG TPA: 2-amino-4-hydroxy-6-hydroxymethyldihydropteridine diphosphokinase [Verrucomicrobiae bacterium]|jgi:2-amino-4-hydroxy-6-hydroxymethyldihydropteridine diphosphokinase|nr:2-amino-4-hydroxy-6-hydroxymethyldihydropteridine diphosphokinase [Verrucomicrobiae bacterium]